MVGLLPRCSSLPALKSREGTRGREVIWWLSAFCVDVVTGSPTSADLIKDNCRRKEILTSDQFKKMHRAVGPIESGTVDSTYDELIRDRLKIKVRSTGGADASS